jgi:hypothetical protein
MCTILVPFPSQSRHFNLIILFSQLAHLFFAHFSQTSHLLLYLTSPLSKPVFVCRLLLVQPPLLFLADD